MLRLAAASYSNTLGVDGSLDALPVAALARLEALWARDDGNGDYVVGGLRRLVEWLARGLDVRTRGARRRSKLRRASSCAATTTSSSARRPSSRCPSPASAT